MTSRPSHAIGFAVLLGALLVTGSGCSRSRTVNEDFSLAGSGSSQADGTGNGAQAGSGALGSGSAGFNTTPDGRRDGNVGGGSAGVPIGTAGSAGGDAPRRADGTPPPPPNGGRGVPDGRSNGGAGAGGVGVAGSTSPPMAGTGGSGASIGHQILNPQDCDSDRPFVLTIQPSGDRGSVSGWLESSPQLAFKDQLPRFDNAPDPDLALWWSIASIDQDNGTFLYFYGENDATRVAVANGARTFDEIDSDSLVFDDWVTPMVGVGAIVVFENVDTKERVAMRVDDVLDTDPSSEFAGGLCAALTASWSFDF